MSEPIRPIRPELLAAKMEKVENFEQPRLLEEFANNPRLVPALCFLQWASQSSNYPGGLSKFSADLIDTSTDRIGPAHMAELGAADKYSPKDAVAIFRELPSIEREEFFGADNALLFEIGFVYEGRRAPDLRDLRSFADDDAVAPCRRRADRVPRKELESRLVAQMAPSVLRSRVSDIARANLADYFKQLCELPHIGFHDGSPWYFVKIAEALLAFIDARAERLRSRVAETEITKEIRRWTAKSRSMQKPVLFIGNSRFGKTEAIELEASADPGSCRVVNTPASNSLSDLLREVAKSLGLEVGLGTAVRDLRERIDYVQRFLHLQLMFDEAQFLLPTNYSRNTAPARLNWVRRSIMDQGIPAVFVCTPQSYLPAKRRFVKATGFAMEQFDERVLARQLPEELGEADLFAVARIHFDDLDENYLRQVVDAVLATERNFVSDVEKIATLAKDNAREHGRKRPILSDIEAAMADVLPTVVETVAPAQKMRPKPAVLRPCKTAAEPLPMPRRGLETLSRDRSIPPAEVPAQPPDST